MMKARSIVLILGLLMSGMTFAQAPGGQGQGRQTDPVERAKRQTEQMKTDLGLSADQTAKVEVINKKYAEKMSEIFKDMQSSGGDRSKVREKMDVLNTEKTAELKPVLTADQLKKYIEIEEKRREEMRQRRSGGQQGPAPERRGQQRGTGN
ncbi:MAG: hypothetical protein ACERKD_03680 [Prolixibacteraceae bacterium]